jgi:hypothetical protein
MLLNERKPCHAGWRNAPASNLTPAMLQSRFRSMFPAESARSAVELDSLGVSLSIGCRNHASWEPQPSGRSPSSPTGDPRPLPEAKLIGGAVANIFDALMATLQDTRLQPDLPDLLWSTVNLFPRAVDRVQRELDANEVAQPGLFTNNASVLYQS